MDAQRGFLEAVRESPGDDLHRLAWADWLDDHGRHDRADFLRASVHAARLDAGDPALPSLEDEAGRLLDAHEREWLGPVAEIALDWRWHAGCVERVTAWAAALLSRGDELLAAAPIRDLRVLGSAEELAALAAWPGLARLDTLDLGVTAQDGEPGLTGFVLRDIQLDALLSSPHLAGVRSLRLSGHGFSGPLVGWLIERGWLRRLRALDLSGCGSFGHGAARMLAAADAPLLESLDLRGTPLNPQGHLPLLGTAWPRLASLALTCGPHAQDLERLTRPGRVRLTARNASWWELRELFEDGRLLPSPELFLNRSGLDGSGLAALAGWPGLAGVRRLEIAGHRLTDSAVIPLAESAHLGAMEWLDLSDNRIGGPGLKALLHAPGLRGLRTLDVSGNHVGVFGAGLIAGAALPRLACLSAADANLDGPALAALAGSPLLRRLWSLDLSGNPLDDDLPRLLAGGPLRLREITLERCRLGPASVAALCDRARFPHLRFVTAPWADQDDLRRRFGAGLLGRPAG